MATTPTPFAAATAGDVGGPTAAEETGEPMSLSSKLMTILAFVAVFTIVLIAIFAMNLAWGPSTSDDKSTDGTVSGGAVEAEADAETDTTDTSHSYVRDYIGVVVSSVMLIMLMPGFYYANAIGKSQ
jgi:hypothetical protein